MELSTPEWSMPRSRSRETHLGCWDLPAKNEQEELLIPRLAGATRLAGRPPSLAFDGHPGTAPPARKTGVPCCATLRCDGAADLKYVKYGYFGNRIIIHVIRNAYCTVRFPATTSIMPVISFLCNTAGKNGAPVSPDTC